MQRDTSDVALYAGDGCNVIFDDQTIKVFHTTSSDVQTYKLIGDKYMLLENRTYTEPDDRQYYTCVDDSVIPTLPSRYDFISPFLHEMAILSAIAILLVAFRLVVYPFFRKGLK